MGFAQPADVGRRGSAAASHHSSSGIDPAARVFGKCQRIVVLAASIRCVRIGSAKVGVDPKGAARCCQGSDARVHRRWRQAVDEHDLGFASADGRQGLAERFSGEQPPVVSADETDPERESGFAGRARGRACFRNAVHRLDQDQIHASAREMGGVFAMLHFEGLGVRDPVGSITVFEGWRGTRDPHPPRPAIRRSPGQRDRIAGEFACAAAKRFRAGEYARLCAERVGGDDLRAGVYVVGMDRRDRFGRVQQRVARPQRQRRPVSTAFEFGSRGTVEQYRSTRGNSIAEFAPALVSAVCWVHRLASPSIAL